MPYIDKNKAQTFLRTECLVKYPASFASGLLAAADQLNKLPIADVKSIKRDKQMYAQKRWQFKNSIFLAKLKK